MHLRPRMDREVAAVHPDNRQDRPSATATREGHMVPGLDGDPRFGCGERDDALRRGFGS